MSRDAQHDNNMEQQITSEPARPDLAMRQSTTGIMAISSNQPPSVQYRSRPVSVAVDPVSLVISECISVTSIMRKHARWAHTSVSSILGGNPNPVQLGPPSPLLRPGSRGSNATSGTDGAQDIGITNRWGLRGKKGKSMQDNPLMAGFGRLRHELSCCKDIHEFDAQALLSPFLQVVISSSTSAPITTLALKAIQKFLSYGFIRPDSPRFPLAMQSLSSAITHCRFEASDSAQDEVVLLMILHLMEDMMSGPGGALLNDESVCEMMETGLTMCCQSRLSELLRRRAEATMVRMCQVIFEHLKHLEVEAGDDMEALDEQANGDMDCVKMVPSTNGGDVIASSDAPPANDPRPSASSDKASSSETEATSETDSEKDIKPYSLPSMKELFRVLVDLLDPHDKQQGDTMRVMALRIIHVALEVAGPSIARHPALATIAEDKLCRHLFQLVRSDNMAILQESLIVAGTLLETCRDVLKLQQELFLSYLVACLHPPVEIPREPGIDPSLYDGIPQAPKLVKPPPSQSHPSSGRSTPVPVRDRQRLGMEGGARKPDARQAMVESVGTLARMPSFLVELFVNYDCDTDRMDLCEDMIGLLSRNALPDSATWSTTSVPPLCLDALLRYIQSIADRLDDEPVYAGYPETARLNEQRMRKKIIIKGANKFNEKPGKGLAFLQSQGIINDVNDPASVANFLKSTSRISKKVLGEYLSKKGNDDLLREFMELFDFNGMRIDQALRQLLESFRLPGESPLIERIVVTFSKRYINSAASSDIADEDAVYVLSYAVIMLNTDQHNKNIKGTSKRMELQDFTRNLRGVNAGKDFAPEYLQAIFEEIKNDEIILPEEHDNSQAFDYAWRELLLKTELAGPLALCNTNIYDADMFATTWKPIVSTLSYVFMSATDDAVFARVVTGFDQCAQIAAKYGITEALDRIIYCLSHMTTLATEYLSNTTLNTEMKVDGASVMVSELAVKFGRDFKAQLATLVLFRVVTGSERVIGNGWQYLVRIWLNLFVNSLVPPFFSSDPQCLDIPIIPLQTPSQVIDKAARSADTGFFSAVSSYISSYAADDPPEPSQEEVDSTLSAVDCVNACHMGDVFANISNLPASDLRPLVKTLLDEVPEDDSSTVPVITVKPEGMSSSPANSPKPQGKRPVYEPSVVYILEFCTVLALRDAETIKLLGKQVAEVLQTILRDSSRHHPILVSRAAFYQFSILKASYEHDFVRAPVLLHAISSFPKETLAKTSQLVLQGLKLCISQPGPLRSEMMTSPDFWLLMRTLAGHPDSSAIVFEILEGGVSGSPSAIIADNYEAAIALLNDFASAAKIGAVVEQKGKGSERRPRNARPPPKKEAPSDNAIVSRGVKAINIIYNMTSRIPHLMKQSHLESSEAWSAYWLPIFKALTTQCTNPCREVRHLALASLQRSLLSPELTCSDHKEWTAIFGEVLFPLILKLLKPEVFSSDRDGMSETRVQAASLLCKVFLQYLVLLSKWDGMLDLWLKIIDILDRLMNSGQGDSLEEAVPENLKNVLLFMSSSGYLVPPSKDQSQEKLWVETWKRIDRFLPDLRNELALEEPRSEETQEAAVEGEAATAAPEKEAEKVAAA